MGADFPIEGDKLKKLIKKSRAVPIPFGFNPGTSDDDDEYLAAHQRKAPEILGKLALNEGAGTKSAFGTFAVDGSEVQLTCFRTIPQLAKKFKKYLKRFKITLNCVVLDPDGNIIDSDVETLDAWFEEADDQEDDVEEAAEAEAEGDAPAEDSGIDPADLAARLRALQPKVAAAPPGVLERMAAGFKGAVGLIREGKLEQASIAIAQLEAVMARLAAMPKAPPASPQGQSSPEASQTVPPVAPPPPDPRLPRLREAVEKLSEQVGALLGNGAGPMLDEMARIDGLIDAGEAEAALGALRSAQETLKAAQALNEKWDKAQAILEPQVNRALSERSVADPDTLRTRWQFAVTLASEGGWDRALAAVPGIVALLRAPAVAPGTDGTPPVGVVAFQSSRILWKDTRDSMLSEARKLADAIIAGSSEDDDAAEIAAAASEILAEVDAVDVRLQGLLDGITNAEGAARDRLRQEASGVVAEYRTLLGAGVFPMIDDNPFASVQVTARARMALDQISRTLA